MKALKILFLTHVFYPSVGGIEITAEILAQAFTDAGHAVQLLTWTADDSATPFPYPVVRQPTARQLLRAHRWADVVFENNPCLRLAWPNLFIARPNVVTLKMWVARTDGTTGWPDRLKRAWFRRASGVIAVSDAIRRGCWPGAVVIGNPYRPALFRPLPGAAPAAAFVFLGRLVPDKGADVAVRALHRLNAAAGGARHGLTIVGAGPERPALEALVAALGLGEQVAFAGPLQGQALAECLNRHRFLLVPSTCEEAFGNVVLEGMACGCVPVASDAGGLPEAVGRAGLTFERGNADALAAALRQVRERPALEQALRAAAPAHLRQHRPEAVAARYLALIQNVCPKPE